MKARAMKQGMARIARAAGIAGAACALLACNGEDGGDDEGARSGGEGEWQPPKLSAECKSKEKGVICAYLGSGESGLGHDGEKPLQVRLYLPMDLTFGPDGLPYVLDWNNHRVRTIRDGVVETVIGTGELGDAKDGYGGEVSLNHPTHVMFDPEGRMLLSAWHNSKIMRWDPATDMLTTLCGDGRRDYGGDGGPADKAVLDLPVATALDHDGRLLIMDQANQRIRRVNADNTIDTVVGPNKDFEPIPAGLVRKCSDNPMMGGAQICKLCTEKEMDDPMCAPRKPQGFAGDDGPGTEAIMYQPFGQQAPPAGRMEMGPDGTLYFADSGNHRIRALDPEGIVRTVAGSGPDHFDPNEPGGYEGDGGPAIEAKLKQPTDLTVAESGNIYIADTHNSCVRKVDGEGIITTVAGKCGERGYEGDGEKANQALLNRPYGVALDADGNLYIADTHNHRIRVVYGVEE